MTITVEVALGDRAYPIHIGRSLMDEITTLSSLLSNRHTVIVTNDVVGPLYTKALESWAAGMARQITTIVLPDGEEHKNAATLDRIYTGLLEAHCDRKTVLIALGGGVVGDMTGFAAATFMRGVDFVQVPTTLLAQVDSSVGGKTGINHPLGKNMIGAFHQPRAVIADLATLDTLPDRELSAGLAEVIKYGAIVDPAFFAWCEENIKCMLARDSEALAYAVRRSCEIKADVVQQDERESGLRAILNFGHTFGHAIEAGLGYGTWLHGEAVGAGMVLAARLSHQVGSLDEASVERIEHLVRAARLPIELPELGGRRFLELMAIDKKAEGGAINYVLLDAIGKARVARVDNETVARVLAEAGQPA